MPDEPLILRWEDMGLQAPRILETYETPHGRVVVWDTALPADTILFDFDLQPHGFLKGGEDA